MSHRSSARTPIARVPFARAARRATQGGSREERELLLSLAQSHGVAGVDLSHSVLDLAALALVPRTVAEADAVLPLARDARNLHVAAAAPDSFERLSEEVRLVTGLELRAYVAVLGPLRDAITRAYDAAAQGAGTWRGAAAPSDAKPHLAIVQPPPSQAVGSADAAAPGPLAAVDPQASGPGGANRGDAVASATRSPAYASATKGGRWS